MRNIYFIVNVEAAIYKDDEWLIIKRSEREENAPGTLAFVGGKVENTTNLDDVLEETLKREIMEEVGVEVYDDTEYVESKAFVSDDGKSVVDIVFLCRYKSGEPRCVSKDEVDEIHWMTKLDIDNNPSAPLYLKKSIGRAEEKRLQKL